ncbi:class I SAM-dependent methyltransferase [Smaragdicoccus niigatensis]|uniref:class I SAM-dependent methyltransferase n=1 Tax=Smaragdicoccus niigatensis TaxID=359359 RepID=UPI00037607F0|nr:class I SAM-dependent methyltransferase [Smaragdicoccus niigatensis]
MTTSDTPRYVLSPEWEHEGRRLALLEQIFDPGATARLTQLGIGPGARCLEIGAGHGSMTRWMCQQVGPTGSVTATDLDTRWISQLDEPNLTVLQHNLLTDDFAPGSFDFIYARAVFEHIADRVNAVPRVCEWLAPGGWLYLDNFSMFTADSSPYPPMPKAWRAFAEMIGRTGTSYEWARTFPKPLVDAGLSDIDAAVNAPVVQGLSPFAEWIGLSLRTLWPRIVEAGIATQADLDAVDQLLTDPNYWDVGPALVGAWGRRAP